MLTRLAHTLTLIGLLTILIPGLAQASQPESPQPAAAQQSKGEWLLQTFDQQNNPIASVALVIATKHEGFLPVAAICGAKSMRVKGHESQTLEVETITVWPDAKLCKITVKAPGFPGEIPPQREEKLKPGDRVSFIPGLYTETENVSTGRVLQRDSFFGATNYPTSILYDREQIGKKVFDESGTLVGYATQTFRSCQGRQYITVISTIVADLAESRSEVHDPSKWAELQTHENDADIVRALFSEGLIRTDQVPRLEAILSSVGDRLDISGFVLGRLLAAMPSGKKLGAVKDIPQMVLNARPESEDAKLRQVTTELDVKNYDKAIPTLQKLIESKDPSIAIVSRYYLSYSLIESGRMNAAKVQVEQLHASHPHHAKVLELITAYYRESKDAATLERVVDELLVVDWSKCNLLSNALYLAEAGRRAPTVKIMSELAVRWPEDTQLRAIVAKYFDEYGMKEKVLEILRAGVEPEYATSKDWQLLHYYESNYKDPNALVTLQNWQANAPSISAFTAPAAGLILDERNVEAGLEMFKKGYAVYSKELEYLYLYTIILIEYRKTQEALQVTQQALKDFPEELNVKVLHASALHADNQYELAKQVCEEVLGSIPEDPNAMLILAQIHKSQGKWTESNQLIHRIRSLPPGKLKELRENWKGYSGMKLLS